MTQDERWYARYDDVKRFIEENHRNPSRHFVENRNLLSWIKQQRKLMNAGKLKEGRRKRDLFFFRKEAKRIRSFSRTPEKKEPKECATPKAPLTSLTLVTTRSNKRA